MIQYHVFYRQKMQKWYVLRNGCKRGFCFNTKQKAIDRGIILAFDHQCSLLIHNKNGKVSQIRSFSKEPVRKRIERRKKDENSD